MRSFAFGAVALTAIASIGSLAIASPTRAAQTRAPSVKQTPIHVETLVRGLANPWGLAFIDGRRIAVTERPGRLRIVTLDGGVSEPVAGLPDIASGGQGGLLDVATSPDFADSGLIYLTYSERRDGGVATSAARGRLVEVEGRYRLDNVKVIFRQQPAVRGRRHFGSRLVFANDGTVFITLGDRGQSDPQDMATHFSKVVRINPDGSVPKDNPFLGQPGALPEIFSNGHRNVQGAALNPQTGELWTVEHGAAGGDEINQPQAGKNYGWPIISYGRHYSGRRIGQGTSKTGLEQPVYYWDPSIAPSGMTFYSGDLFPEWKGNLFVGALKFRQLRRLVLERRSGRW